MQTARRSHKRHREERRFAVEQYTGPRYTDEGDYRAQAQEPINLISQYISIVGRNLIAKNPRVMLSTFDRSNKPAVSAMQTWSNNKLVEMHFAETAQRVVLDALFAIGILKIGLATPADAATYSWNLKAGQPFACRVDLDDFVYDIHARDFSEVSFIGHRYRAPLELIRDSSLYSKGRKDLVASADPMYNLEGDERVSTMGRGYIAGNTEEFEEFVDLWEVYLPRHRLVYTFADDDVAGATSVRDGDVAEALRCQTWVGPDNGPYHILPFGIVPGNAFPKGKIPDLIDLHLFANNSYRKLIDQTERQKTLLLVQGGAMEDGNRIQKASDGEIIRCDNPAASVEAKHGGADQQTIQMFLNCHQMFNELAGNLALMGGIAPQSKTATQDKMLNENSAGGIADMQDTTITFVSEAVKSLCWYWWHDPYLTMKVNHSVPGLPQISTVSKITPQQRTGAFEDLDIKIDPYSMQHSTPQSKLGMINQIVKELWLPMSQQAAQSGVTFDYQTFFKMVSQLTDTPEIMDFLTIQDPPNPETGTGTPTQQPGGETVHTRVSMPGRTDKGNEQNMIAQTAGVDNGGASKNGQMNGAMR